MTTASHLLTRDRIREGLANATPTTLMHWQRVLQKRRDDMVIFIPEWPGLAQSIDQDLEVIAERMLRA